MPLIYTLHPALGTIMRLNRRSRRRLTDGLVSQFAGGKVRVRLDDERAWLTVKADCSGLARSEFEYENPRTDTEAWKQLH